MRVVDGAGLARYVDDVIELAAESDLLAQRRDPALEPERRHRHPPAVARGADDVVGSSPGAVEEDLVELRRAGDLHDRPDVDAGLLHRHEQVGQPGMLRGFRVAAGQHEAPVGDVRQRCPHLLPGDDPLVAVAHCRSAYAGQVGPGTRLGVALAPQLLAGEDAGQEPLTLLVGAAREQRRRKQLLADVVDPVRRSRLGVLLVEDDLLHEARTATALLPRPAETDPAVGAEQPLPLTPGLEPLVLTPRSAGVAQRGELTDEVLAEPVAHLGAEGLVLGREAQVHAPYRNLTRCQKRRPSRPTASSSTTSQRVKVRRRPATTGHWRPATAGHWRPATAGHW